MRVVHYYHWALDGEFGTAIAVRGWSGAMAAAGDRVRLVTGTTRAVVEPPAGVEVISMPRGIRDVPRMSVLRRAFRGADVVVLHGGWDPRNHLAARVARRLDVPYVVTAHGVYYPEVFERRKRLLKSLWWNVLERAHLERAMAIHLFYRPEAEHLRRRHVRTPIVFAPNGFVAPRDVRWEPDGARDVVWLGRFDPEHKGLDLLLEAMSVTPEEARPRLRLFGVDWHGQKASIAQLAQRLGVDRDVAIEQPVYGEAKWEILRSARGFVYPSRWDAAPMAVVEAGSIGMPLLVTRFPVASFLAERGAAIQVDPTPEALSSGLTRLDGPEAAEHGRRAASVIRDELSWDRVAATWRDQVGALLSSGTPDGRST
jgi:glycosyltransferase involved in cell wall biosynthesis